MLKTILEPLKADLDRVNECIERECHCAHSELLKSLLKHTFSVRGKLLRPAIALCSAHITGGCSDDRPILIAAGLEILHTASLVHDDIIDNGSYRRGQTTVNEAWGVGEATLLGDWLLAKSFDLMVRTEHPGIIHGMTVLTEELTEGQFLEMELSSKRPSERDYLKMIDLKTSSLFRRACSFGAMLATKDPLIHNQLLGFGSSFGLYFQIIDDLLDVLKAPQEILKSSQLDIKNGLKTLPILKGLEIELRLNKTILHNALENGVDTSFLKSLPDYLNELGVVQMCLKEAARHRDRCTQYLDNFPSSRYKILLLSLLDLIQDQINPANARSQEEGSS
jgi:octaprenyl-diphosphate synthase